jgi:hypothetical protein
MSVIIVEAEYGTLSISSMEEEKGASLPAQMMDITRGGELRSRSGRRFVMKRMRAKYCNARSVSIPSIVSAPVRYNTAPQIFVSLREKQTLSSSQSEVSYTQAKNIDMGRQLLNLHSHPIYNRFHLVIGHVIYSSPNFIYL